MSHDETFTREDTTFASHGTACAVWLYRPVGVERPPVIVMAHGFAAVRELRLDAYAERFARAGYAVVVFDYRGWGTSDGEPHRILNIRAQQADWRAAVAYARSLPDVDTERVVAWGTSFGGGHVLHLAAHDRGLAAVIAQVPHVSGPASALSVPPRTLVRLVRAAVRDKVGALAGRPPLRVAAVGDPGETAMMSAPGAFPLVKRLAGDRVDEIVEHNEVAARIGLELPLYSPGRLAGRITAPTLVQVAKNDVVTPFPVAMRAARRIPRGEVLVYDCGHFEPYVDPYFEAVVGDQIAFLDRTVRPELAAAGVEAAPRVRAPRRTALFTGASAGIGAAFAEHLAAEGYDLILVARREERLRALAARLEEQHGTRSEVLAADLSDPGTPRRIVEHAQGHGLTIDVLVNNAGLSGNDAFADTPWDTHRSELQVMVGAVTELAHLVVPQMRERGWGRIVNLSSIAAFQPDGAGLLYTAIKSYVLHASQAMDMELKPQGIHVTALCPGFTHSEFHDVMGTREAASALPDVLWQTPEAVVREGWRAVMKGRPVCVPGPVNKVLATSMRPVPLRAQYLLGRTLNPFDQG